MNVILVSQDADLYQLCRELLTGFPADEWHLSMATAADSKPADLYIWDIQTGADLPRQIDQRLSKHLFLIQRNEIDRFYRDLGDAEANIVLKPVTRATLAAFLGLAIAAHRGGATAGNSSRTDRDDILQCLIQANRKLQEYDQDRTNFLARAVHDFRAPLTAVTGYCGLLLGENLGTLTEEQKEVLRRMHHSTKRLSRLAAAMFQLSVGRHVKNHPDLHKGDIRECVDQALHELGPAADGKGISISVDLDDEPGALFFERGQIEQVVINLLDNACKFTPKGGQIAIRGYAYFWERRALGNHNFSGGERRRQDSRRFNSYRIDIRNSGHLIPPEHLDDIFEEYTTYAGGQDRSGGGLGLAICRMIATQHHGRVWADNAEDGPMFSFVLPVYSTGAGSPDHLETRRLTLLMEAR